MEVLELGDRRGHLAVGFQTQVSRVGASAQVEMTRVPTLAGALEDP